MSEAASAQVPLDVLQRLQPMAEQLGISLPGVTRFAPKISVTQPIRGLALELGRLLARNNIFVKAGEVVSVDEKTGEVQRMTPRRFPAWAEEFCAFEAPGVRRVRDSLAVDDASQILESDIFRGCLRPLEGVHLIRLPVRRADSGIEFLEPGYDAASRIFTAETLRYDMTWPRERALEFLNEHGKEYPWSWPEGADRKHVQANRNWSVQVAAMVGTFCRALFAPGTLRPMITYIGNQAGTGKSTLVGMALIPVWGHCSATKNPKDDDKMDSELETVARTLQPYLFFDDIGAGIFSNPLNRFLTASSHAGRVMGGNADFFRMPSVTQVFSTGNDIKLSTDLMRRSLIVELFLPGDVRGRHFARTISQQYLATPEVRANFLAALCALVRNYIEAAATFEPGALKHPSPLESFEDWTETIGAIVQASGFNDPLMPPELAGGGAEDDDEMRELLIKVATAAAADEVFTRKELVETARTLGLIENLVGSTGDKDPDSSQIKKFGRQLQRWRGRELVDERGRRFRFARQRQKRGATYPLAFL